VRKPLVVDRKIVIYEPVPGDTSGLPQRQEFYATLTSRYTYKGVPCIDLPRYWGLVK
jgi:hypothetical protein